MVTLPTCAKTTVVTNKSKLVINFLYIKIYFLEKIKICLENTIRNRNDAFNKRHFPLKTTIIKTMKLWKNDLVNHMNNSIRAKTT